MINISQKNIENNVNENKTNISSLSNKPIEKTLDINKRETNLIKEEKFFKEKDISNSMYYFDKKAKEFVLKITREGINYQFPTENILKLKEYLLKNENDLQIV